METFSCDAYRELTLQVYRRMPYQEYKLIPFLKKTPFDYEIIADGRYITSLFDVSSYPTNIIVDNNGIIQFYEIGFKSDILERMTSAMDTLIDL